MRWPSTRLLIVTAAAACGSPTGPVVDTDRRTPLDLASIAWGNGRYVAVGTVQNLSRSDGQYVYTPYSDTAAIVWSADGREWHRATLAESAGTVHEVAFGAGAFVAVGHRSWQMGDPLLLRSETGAHWTPIPLSPDVEWRSIVRGNGVFLAGGTDRGTRRGVLMRSADGVRWEMAMDPMPLGGRITFGNGLFVLTGEFGGVAFSEDGVEWDTQPLPPLNFIHAARYVGGRFVAYGVYDCCFGELPDLIRHYTVTSTDGRQWQAAERTDRLTLWGLAEAGGTYVGLTPDRLFVSDDPVTGWTVTRIAGPDPARPELGAGWFSQVVFAGGRFVAIGRGRILTSHDGRFWQDARLPD